MNLRAELKKTERDIGRIVDRMTPRINRLLLSEEADAMLDPCVQLSLDPPGLKLVERVEVIALSAGHKAAPGSPDLELPVGQRIVFITNVHGSVVFYIPDPRQKRGSAC